MNGNVSGFRVLVAAFDPPAVPANSVSDWLIPVAGLTAGMFGIAKPAGPLTTGLSIQRVTTTAGNIALRVDNVTAAPIDIAVGAWEFFLFPPAGEDIEV